jgi:hypothetical protein
MLRLLLSTLLLTATFCHAQGLGDLAVTPTRVIFEGRTRTSEVSLTNKGRGVATYRISFTHTRMDESGKVAECAKEEGQVTAEDLVRFSPREVTLAPGITQVVRIQLRKPENLQTGEYRSQLLFRAVPPAEKVEAPAPDDGKQELKISIRPIFGLSIPVVVRQGETTCKLNLTDLALQPASQKGEPPRLELRLLREGNQSMSGTLQAFWTLGKGKPVLAGEMTCAIYHPLPFIKVALPLDKLGDKALAGGTLMVKFLPRDAKEPVAQTPLDLP